MMQLRLTGEYSERSTPVCTFTNRSIGSQPGFWARAWTSRSQMPFTAPLPVHGTRPRSRPAAPGGICRTRRACIPMRLQVLQVLGGLFLTLLILLHKGKGGGLSDMFGGGMSSSLGGSSVAERNLDRITVGVALVWFTCVVAIGVLERFAA